MHHKYFDSVPLTCSFIRDSEGAVGVRVPVMPAELCSLLAVEEPMRQRGDFNFHLGLTVKAGVSSLRTVDCHTVSSTGSPRGAAIWANRACAVLKLLF